MLLVYVHKLYIYTCTHTCTYNLGVRDCIVWEREREKKRDDQQMDTKTGIKVLFRYPSNVYNYTHMNMCPDIVYYYAS